MNPKQLTKFSRFLSLVLRHKPETIGIQLDHHGWTDVNQLLKKCSEHGRHYSRQDLQTVVDTNDKKRFAFSDDGKLIRASQGHSVDVQLGLKPKEPPEFLWHGTASRFLGSIYQQGLTKQGRQHVHLSADSETARAVGQRHGRLVLLKVLARQMHRDGHEFFLSANGVWLTDHVSVQYLQ
jgi:putative RNA 2'-phosphotransferase